MDTIASSDLATRQRTTALQVANARRLQTALMKKQLRTGALPLTTVMSAPPELLAGTPLIDIVRWAYASNRRTAAIEQLGRQAVIDNVNLMVPLGRASAKSRAWVARQGLRCWRPCTK